jgi:pantoate--beta-alanine ligase
MIILKKADDIKNYLAGLTKKGSSIGFVPTMGALHSGHISLITKANTENNLVVCSIFVNPTQFNDPKDFEKYPITIEQDIYLLEKAGCSVLFLPSVDEMYPNGTTNLLHFDLGFIETILDGKYRPGHFQGVCQVVHRLLEIVLPGKLYLGQKDFQQCMVLTKMAETYYPSLQIVICPTQREQDGLAMSSRNLRLTPEDRLLAPYIFSALELIKNIIKPGNIDKLKQSAIEMLTAKGFKVDYVEICSYTNLKLLNDWDGNDSIVILIAAFLNSVRLIDNMLIK